MAFAISPKKATSSSLETWFAPKRTFEDVKSALGTRFELKTAESKKVWDKVG